MNALGAKQFAKKAHAIINRLQSLAIPVVAAVNGFALGGGSEIALPVISSMLHRVPDSGFRKSIWALFPVLAGPRERRGPLGQTGPRK